MPAMNLAADALRANRVLSSFPLPAILLASLLSLVGCEAPPVLPNAVAPNYPASGFVKPEDSGQLAHDLARLDHICWYIVITRTHSADASRTTLHCKIDIGTESDVAAYAEGESMTDAVALVLSQIETLVPATRSKSAPSDRHGRLLTMMADLQRLNEKCWQIRLEKSLHWSATVKARRPDELVTRSVRVKGEVPESAVHTAWVELLKTEPLLR